MNTISLQQLKDWDADAELLSRYSELVNSNDTSIQVCDLLTIGLSIYDLIWIYSKAVGRGAAVQLAIDCTSKVIHLAKDLSAYTALTAARTWVKNPQESCIHGITAIAKVSWGIGYAMTIVEESDEYINPYTSVSEYHLAVASCEATMSASNAASTVFAIDYAAHAVYTYQSASTAAAEAGFYVDWYSVITKTINTNLQGKV